jgi:hypothetical protein
MEIQSLVIVYEVVWHPMRSDLAVTWSVVVNTVNITQRNIYT